MIDDAVSSVLQTPDEFDTPWLFRVSEPTVLEEIAKALQFDPARALELDCRTWTSEAALWSWAGGQDHAVETLEACCQEERLIVVRHVPGKHGSAAQIRHVCQAKFDGDVEISTEDRPRRREKAFSHSHVA